MLLVADNHKKNRMTKAKLTEAAFWLGILCELIVSFSGYLFGGYGEPYIILLGMCSFFVVIVSEADWKNDIFLFLLAAIFGGLCYICQGSALIIRVLLFLIAGRKRNAKNVMKLFFWGTLIIMLLGWILAALGIHNSVSITDRFRSVPETRYCFGFYHPNGFSMFYLKLIFMGIYVYGQELRVWKYLAATVVSVGILLMTRSKMALVCLALIFFLYTFVRYCGKEKYAVKVVYGFSVASITGILLLLVITALFYHPLVGAGEDGGGFWDYANRLTTGRLGHAYDVIHQLDITLLGYGNTVKTTEIGYVNAFYEQGLIFLTVYCVGVYGLQYRMKKEKNLLALVVITGVVCYSFAEAFLPYWNKNLILLLAMGIQGMSGKKGYCIGNRQKKS